MNVGLKYQIKVATHRDHYPQMEGDSPLAKKFNKLQAEYWIATSGYIEPNDLIVDILIEDFNSRHESDHTPETLPNEQGSGVDKSPDVHPYKPKEESHE